MLVNRHIQPRIEFLDSIRTAEPEIAYLDNGIPVYLIDTPGQDIIKIEMLFEAGKWFEEKPLIATLTNKMLKEGTQSLSSKEIAGKIDFYGAHLESSSDKDMAYLSLYTLNKHLENTLPVLADVIINPSFPENELETLKQNRKQRFVVNNRKVRFVAKRRFNALIYGHEHPYGRSFEVDDYELVSKQDIEMFHNRHYTAGNCKIIVAGKIKDNILGLLNKHLSGFDGGAEQPAPYSGLNGFPVNQLKKKVEKEDAVQSAIRIGRILFNKKHEDYARMKIVNTILGGYFGSRLMTNIREDKGYTYGIGSAIVSMQHSGYFFIASEVGSDVTDQALKEVYFEINKLQQDLVPEQELDLVKNYMLGSFLRSLDGAFALSENFKGLLEYGLDYNYYKDFVRVIKDITPAEIRDLACKYLGRKELTELTVGK